VAYGEPEGGLYETTMNRLYLLYLMKLHVISKGYTVTSYKIIWEGREIFRETSVVEVETLLIPTWLPSENQGSIWIVVKHMTKIVIVYVGKEVTGPKITACGDDDDPYNSEEDENSEIEEGECKYGGVTLVPEIGPGDGLWCKTLNPRGKCSDQVNPDGHCGCRKSCECINPYLLFHQRSKVVTKKVLVNERGPASSRHQASDGNTTKKRSKNKSKKNRSKRNKKRRSKNGSRKG